MQRNFWSTTSLGRGYNTQNPHDMSQLQEVTPHIRLDLQDHIENIDYMWVTMAQLEGKLSKCTTNLRKAHAELSSKG